MITMMTAALLAASALSPVSVAPAAGDVSRVSAPNGISSVDGRWGVNDDGWKVIIRNELDLPLTPDYGIFSNVEHVDPAIAVNETNRNTRGAPSIFGGPANMDLTLRKFNPILEVPIDMVMIRIVSDWTSSAPSVVCTELHTDVSCDVSTPSIDVPVQVTVRWAS